MSQWAAMTNAMHSGGSAMGGSWGMMPDGPDSSAAGLLLAIKLAVDVLVVSGHWPGACVCHM